MSKAWKGVIQNWETVAQQSEEEKFLLCLNQRETAVLLGSLLPLKWRTRWLNLPLSEDLHFIDTLEAKLMSGNVCCDDILDCVNTPEGIKIIQEIIRGGGGAGGGGGFVTEPMGKTKSELALCSEDYVFGAITRLVDFVLEKVRDFFDRFETSTNLFEIADEWLGLFGIQLPETVQSILDYLEWIQDAIYENFEAQWTIALRDEYRCDLFCMWMDNCQGLTPQQCAEYFLDRIGGEGLIGNMWDVVTFLVAGSWSGTQIVDATFASVFGIMVAGENFLPFINIGNVYTFNNVVLMGSDEPDNDWMFLCDTCVSSWCAYLDFTTSSYNPIVSIKTTYTGFSYGQYVASVGYQTLNYGSGGGQGDLLHVSVDMPELTNITKIVMYTAPYVEAPTTLRAMYTVSGGSPDRFAEATSEGTELEWNGDADFLEWWLQAVNSGVTPDKITIVGLRLEGTGENPFPDDPCPL